MAKSVQDLVIDLQYYGFIRGHYNDKTIVFTRTGRNRQYTVQIDIKKKHVYLYCSVIATKHPHVTPVFECIEELSRVIMYQKKTSPLILFAELL